MRILITGSSGVIGRILAKALSTDHALIMADLRTPEETSDLEYRAISPLHVFLRMDISDRLAVQDVFAIHKPEAVLHLAAVLGRQTSWERVLSWNIDAAVNVLEIALASQTDRVIYASTNNVYGGYEEEATANGVSLHMQERPLMLHEDMPVRPDSRYAVAKLMIEQYATFLANRFGLRTIGLRIGTVRDIDDPEAQTEELRLIPRFKSTWLYHQDLIQLVRLCLLTDVKQGIYNAISGHPGLPGIFIDITKPMKELDYHPRGRGNVRQ